MLLNLVSRGLTRAHTYETIRNARGFQIVQQALVIVIQLDQARVAKIGASAIT